MNRGGTLGSRHCHCMLQLPAFTQRFSKFYFLPTVSEPLQWTQPEWPASHKKPFRGKLNDLETRPSKAFKGLQRPFWVLPRIPALWLLHLRMAGSTRRKDVAVLKKANGLVLPCRVFLAHIEALFLQTKRVGWEIYSRFPVFGSFFSKTKLPPIPALIKFFRAFLSIFMIQLLMEPLAGCHLGILVYKAEDFSSRPFSRHLCLLNNSRFFHGWKCSGCTQAWGKPTSKPTQIWNW